MSRLRRTAWLMNSMKFKQNNAPQDQIESQEMCYKTNKGNSGSLKNVFSKCTIKKLKNFLSNVLTKTGNI